VEIAADTEPLTRLEGGRQPRWQLGGGFEDRSRRSRGGRQESPSERRKNWSLLMKRFAIAQSPQACPLRE